MANKFGILKNEDEKSARPGIHGPKPIGSGPGPENLRNLRSDKSKTVQFRLSGSLVPGGTVQIRDENNVFLKFLGQGRAISGHPMESRTSLVSTKDIELSINR